MSFSGFFLSNPVHNKYDGGTSYLHHRGSTDEQHFDIPCQLFNVARRASDDPVSDIVCADDSETDDEMPKMAPSRSI